MCRVPSADTDSSGANANETRLVPGGSWPLPCQCAPWSVDRQKRSGPHAAQSTYTLPQCGLHGLLSQTTHCLSSLVAVVSLIGSFHVLPQDRELKTSMP